MKFGNSRKQLSICKSLLYRGGWSVVYFIPFYGYCKKTNQKLQSRKDSFHHPRILCYFIPTNWVVSHFQVVSLISLGKCNFMQCNSDLHSYSGRGLISLSSWTERQNPSEFLNVSYIFFAVQHNSSPGVEYTSCLFLIFANINPCNFNKAFTSI